MATISCRDALLLFLVFAALLVRLLLSPSIWHHGEAREGLVIQGIVHNHEWILPFRNGELPSKPPLFHWIAALTALVLGLSDSIVRLPSVIGAEVMAIATFLMGRAMGGRKVGWLAVGALLGMYEFWDSGVDARVDMVFSASITVSIAGFFFWYRAGRETARVACYIASGFAVLAKGPAGIALPGVVIVGFLAAEGKLQVLWKLWSWPLAGLVLVIDLGWYALAYQIGGNEFLRLQILHENVDRALGVGRVSDHSQYLQVLLWLATLTLPWNLALLWSLIRRVRGEREDAAGRLLHIWWISISAVFMLVAGKRAVYLLPIYPAIALLAARSIDEMTLRLTQSSRRLRTAGVGIVLFDLTLMFANHDVWEGVKSKNARLAFIEKINATIPAHAPLFATPEVDNTALIVIAYRLRREINRKPIARGEPNDYFLSPLKGGNLAGFEPRVLVSSETDRIALVSLLSGKPAS